MFELWGDRDFECTHVLWMMVPSTTVCLCLSLLSDTLPLTSPFQKFVPCKYSMQPVCSKVIHQFCIKTVGLLWYCGGPGFVMLLLHVFCPQACPPLLPGADCSNCSVVLCRSMLIYRRNSVKQRPKLMWRRCSMLWRSACRCGWKGRPSLHLHVTHYSCRLYRSFCFVL